ncbi:hypothetical protein K469DRAFT_713940 [Zopfia rhizophila CBS 207.26]|uniref:Uncharacterized protein n=1 Tax=Zopfia rhizophila CBS 207.26 TaxID=1314779 RepID=A0A6A6DPY5_9PEZI|nr:hypothetical protein K469DRAFT_713940 [Zopfia rhizophila CBS 207.26]
MVYILHSSGDMLKAYLTAKLTPQELESIHKAFELGAHSQFPTPLAELYIEDKPEYYDLTHSEIRKAETQEQPLLLIDKETPSDGGVWYIDSFASEDEVEDGEAESTDVLWKIRMKIEDVPILHAGYDIANSSIQEDLGNCGVELPVTEEFEQPKICTSGINHDENRYQRPAWVTAEPGDFEESTENLFRLKEDVAKSNGLLSGWTPASTAKEVTMRDGSIKTFPEGSVVLQVRYDPDYAWPSYRRPEGSL